MAPDYLDPLVVRRQFISLLRSRPVRHRKLFLASSSLLPFTSTVFTFLPGPNVFFLWNAFRTYMHYQSFLGSKHLAFLCTPQEARELPGKKDWKKSLHLPPAAPFSPPVTLDANLSLILKSREENVPFDDAALLSISRSLGLNDTAVKFFKRVQAQVAKKHPVA